MPEIAVGGIEIAAFHGKTIFEQNRYTVHRPPHEANEPLLLVLACSNGFDLERWAREVPERLWRRVAEGQTRIVFDATTEAGLFDPAATAKMLEFMAGRGVSANQATYLTQDRGWEADYRAVYDLPPPERMQVLYADYFIRRYFQGLAASGPDLFEARHERFLARDPHRQRRFISFNLTPRESKVVFLLQLMRDGLWDQALVSFGGFGMSHRVKPMRVREWSQELDALAPWRERLEGMGRFVIGDEDNTKPDYRTPVHDMDLPEHDRTWFSVVTETEMRNRPSRITEKPCKPLVNFHPLIFLGNPGSLPLVRELGFETFEGFFDESYDQEWDAKIRFRLVYDQIMALCRADETELARRSALVAERLVHNARWGLTELPRIFRKKRDYALLNAILN